MNIELASGKELDAIALKLGLKRRIKWFIFKESDKSLRQRVDLRVQMICNRQISVLGCKYVGTVGVKEKNVSRRKN